MIEELTPPERWVWIGLLLMGGDSTRPGVIFSRLDADHNPVGFTEAYLADALDIDLDTLTTAIKKMGEREKIRVDERRVIYILNWHKYQSEYLRQQPYQKAYRLKKSKKTIKRGCKTSIHAEGEGEIEGDREGEGESSAFLPIIKKTFEDSGHRFNKKTLLYIANLCAEFPELDHVAEIQKKIAWWVNHPLTKKSNICLQLRNWFEIARRQYRERQVNDRVGARPRGYPTAEAATQAARQAYEEFKQEYMKAYGLGSTDDIDLFHFPTFEEFRKLKVSNPDVLKALLQPKISQGDGK